MTVETLKAQLKNRSWQLAACLLFLTTGILRSQCSDAGICSIGNRPVQQRLQLALDFGFGASSSPDDLTFYSITGSAFIPIFDRSYVTVMLPFNRQSGPLGATSGIGDLTAVWTQVLSETDSQLKLNVGVKMSLADVNSGMLPQSYQSGLGTNDLLAGISFEPGEWRFSIGYQLSRGRSENRHSRLKRGDDLLISAGYGAQFGRLTAAGEILAIKRLHESNILMTPGQPVPIYGDVPGSDQFQINVVGRISYPLMESARARGSVAFPVLKRDINIDGLKRSLSLSLGLEHEF